MRINSKAAQAKAEATGLTVTKQSVTEQEEFDAAYTACAAAEAALRRIVSVTNARERLAEQSA